MHPRAYLEIFLSVCCCNAVTVEDIDLQARAEDTKRNFPNGQPRYWL